MMHENRFWSGYPGATKPEGTSAVSEFKVVNPATNET